MQLRGLLLQPAGTHSGLTVVVGHGITNRVTKPFVHRVLQRLACSHTVVALDFRGHGRSGGRCTAGPAEVHDLTAAVRLARRVGPGPVATLGFSMGASVALVQAAGAGGADRPDAVASVSAACRWWARQTPSMRRLFWFAERPHGRVLLRTVGLRLAPPPGRDVVPVSPLEVVARIGPTPLLLVHGTEDHYLPVEHATALHAATGGTARLWLRPGMGHAETAMTPSLVDEIGGWLAQAVSTGGTGSDQRTGSERAA